LISITPHTLPLVSTTPLGDAAIKPYLEIYIPDSRNDEFSGKGLTGIDQMQTFHGVFPKELH
jgi:hypothetical protein